MRTRAEHRAKSTSSRLCLRLRRVSRDETTPPSILINNQDGNQTIKKSTVQRQGQVYHNERINMPARHGPRASRVTEPSNSLAPVRSSSDISKRARTRLGLAIKYDAFVARFPQDTARIPVGIFPGINRAWHYVARQPAPNDGPIHLIVISDLIADHE
jgi:hypothetical protein